MRKWIKTKRRQLRDKYLFKKQAVKNRLRGSVLRMLGLTSSDLISLLETNEFRHSNVFDTLVDEAADKAIENVSISAVGDYMSDEIQDWITLDYSSIAENLCLSSLAYEIDGSDLAQYVDVSDIAENIDADDVAIHIDNDELAVHVVKKIGELLSHRANSIV